MGSYSVMSMGFLFKDEKVLEIGGGKGCTTL